MIDAWWRMVKTKKAVEGGAKIVSFQEYAMVINQEEENILREDLERIARENDTYLSITYAYFSEVEKGGNKHLFINGNGDILLDYTKRCLLRLGPYGFGPDRRWDHVCGCTVRGIRVPLPLIGNLFAWINLLALAMLVVLGAGMVYGKNGEFIQKIRQAQ
jgi:hypothetical protein